MEYKTINFHTIKYNWADLVCTKFHNLTFVRKFIVCLGFKFGPIGSSAVSSANSGLKITTHP